MLKRSGSMRDHKGISMISLIVTIVCIIVLSSLAIGTGTKYIRESKSQNKETFISVMSSAVSRRYEDSNLNSVSYPYLGYHINDSTIFERVFAPKVSEPITFEDSSWYVVDAATAKALGVKEPDEYIETIDVGYVEGVTVALVDYVTGEVYLINVNSDEITGLPNEGTGPVLGHIHRYIGSYPTCTEARKCADCGFIDAEPLGHLYDSLATPQPASGDEENAHYNKVCIRPGCGMQGGYEKHLFDYTHIVKSNVWYHKTSCTVCGYTRKNADGTEKEEKCTIGIKLPDSELEKPVSHICFCRVCSHEEKENHNYAYRSISDSMHEKYCSNTLCNYLILREPHVDNDSDDFCDLCNAPIVSYEYPELSMVEFEKIDPTPATEEDKYIAKYTDTVELRFVSDKQVTNVQVYIGGHLLNSSIATITSSDNKNWSVTYKLDNARFISDGELTFSINCESMSGVQLPERVTSTTNNKTIIFDGTNPIVEYIPKTERIDEI